mgnify:CR=1 FL=1
MLFVLAKEWADLVSTYLLRLHSTPFCTECVPEAAARAQVIFTFQLLLLAAVLKSVAVCVRPEGRRVPTMLGMAVGWAAGDACVAALREASSSGALDALLAGLTTLLCGLIIAVLQPWTLSFDFADGPVEALLQSFWQLCSKVFERVDERVGSGAMGGPSGSGWSWCHMMQSLLHIPVVALTPPAWGLVGYVVLWSLTHDK